MKPLKIIEYSLFSLLGELTNLVPKIVNWIWIVLFPGVGITLTNLACAPVDASAGYWNKKSSADPLSIFEKSPVNKFLR